MGLRGGLCFVWGLKVVEHVCILEAVTQWKRRYDMREEEEQNQYGCQRNKTKIDKAVR